MALTIQPISEREFDLYALSLPTGPNFDNYIFHAAWKTPRSTAVGAVLTDPVRQNFRSLIMRRKIDHRFNYAYLDHSYTTPDDAAAAVADAMRPDAPAEPLSPGEKRRRELFVIGKRQISKQFEILVGTRTHIPALMTIGEVYLAMPNPDANFVPDFQTENFDSRLWELYLLACFREQGAMVTQDHLSPDFHIERDGHTCWVEAVTTNPQDRTTLDITVPVYAPEDPAERLLGAPAARFAKTLRSKLQREYEDLPQVRDQPFALGIADFHAPSSMVWSREALPCYLYGIHPRMTNGPDGRLAVVDAISTLLDSQQIPAGLFRDPKMAHLSAIIFSNAATFAKFNRMGFLAWRQPKSLTMVRDGVLFDRNPGALQPIPFKLDVLSDEYASLWPDGEFWCQELEVFHNPQAKHPVDLDLLPGATHWFELNGEIECSTIWEWSVLSSITHLNISE